MRPTSGGNAKFPSGASILFSSPLPRNRVMGAGGRSGPDHREACPQGGQQSQRERELRHEHAPDEQRVRHRDVAQRGLRPSTHRIASTAPRGAPFSLARRGRRSRPASRYCATLRGTENLRGSSRVTLPDRPADDRFPEAPTAPGRPTPDGGGRRDRRRPRRPRHRPRRCPVRGRDAGAAADRRRSCLRPPRQRRVRTGEPARCLRRAGRAGPAGHRAGEPARPAGPRRTVGAPSSAARSFEPIAPRGHRTPP